MEGNMAIDASVGARVGEYILVKKLGEGGMAEVWLARHSVSAQLRAIKFLNKNFQGIPEVEARFQTEGESQLVHPNIVRIYQVGQESGSSYLVMDFIDGRDLEKILDSRRGPLTVPEALDVGLQILAGLGFAHASGIVHRDIKPSNVLIDSEGQAYLMDFGIAKALRGTRSVTQVNSRLGTPDYMSPEQIRNPRDVDRRSDIYSFGCLFYELLTGWPPFDRGAGYETEHDIKTAHCTEPPMPPLERKANLPARLNDVTLQCLAKAKEDRPQSCEEIYAVLDAYRASTIAVQQPRTTTPAPTPKQPSTPGIAPAIPPRRETVVLTPNPVATPAPPVFPSQPGIGAGFGNVSRTPTVTDDAIYGNRDVTPQPAQPPFTQPSVPTYVPTPITPVADKVDKGDAAKGKQTMILVLGSLLLLIALGGGGWFIFHKEPPPKEDTNSSSGSTNSGGVQQAANSNPVSDPGKTSPASNIPAQQTDPAKPVLGQKIPPPQAKEKINSDGPKQAIAPIQLPVKNTPAAPASGTLTWTGDATAVGKHVTIIRSMSAALQGGEVKGAMFPAGPVRITVRPAGSATVIPPSAKTNFNSVDIFLPNPGQQTIYLDWTALPNP